MRAQPQPYKVNVNPGSELAAIIETAEAEQRPIILEKKGVTYDVVRRADDIQMTDGPRADYDPERVLRAIAKGAGALKGIDVEAFTKEIYEAREQDTPGRPA